MDTIPEPHWVGGEDFPSQLEALQLSRGRVKHSSVVKDGLLDEMTNNDSSKRSKQTLKLFSPT